MRVRLLVHINAGITTKTNKQFHLLFCRYTKIFGQHVVLLNGEPSCFNACNDTRWTPSDDKHRNHTNDPLDGVFIKLEEAVWLQIRRLRIPM